MAMANEPEPLTRTTASALLPGGVEMAAIELWWGMPGLAWRVRRRLEQLGSYPPPRSLFLVTVLFWSALRFAAIRSFDKYNCCGSEARLLVA